MCQSKSMIATKDKLIESPFTNSHSELLAIHNIQDLSPTPSFVKLEITPPCKGSLLNFQAWNFQVDQDRFPDWFVAEEWEKRARHWLETEARYLSGEHKQACGHFLFAESADITFLCGRSSIDYVLNSTIAEIKPDVCIGHVIKSRIDTCGGKIEHLDADSIIESLYGRVEECRGEIGIAFGNAVIKHNEQVGKVGQLTDSSNIGCNAGCVIEMHSSSSVKSHLGGSIRTMAARAVVHFCGRNAIVGDIRDKAVVVERYVEFAG